MLVEDDNVLDYFMYHNKEKFLLDNKEQDIKKDQKDLMGKSSNNKIIKSMLLGRTLQNEFLASKLLLSLKEV